MTGTPFCFQGRAGTAAMAEMILATPKTKKTNPEMRTVFAKTILVIPKMKSTIPETVSGSPEMIL